MQSAHTKMQKDVIVSTLATASRKGLNNMTAARYVPIYHVQLVRERKVPYGGAFENPEAIARFLRPFFETCPVEKVFVILLDTGMRPIGVVEVSSGTLNMALMSPREVLMTALLANAANIVLSHNHPSGQSTPSQEDIQVTKRIKEACTNMQIELVDHIIWAEEGFSSLRQLGKI